MNVCACRETRQRDRSETRLSSREAINIRRERETRRRNRETNREQQRLHAHTRTHKLQNDH